MRHPIYRFSTNRIGKPFFRRFLKYFSELTVAIWILLTFLPLAGSQEIPRASLARQRVQETLPASANLKIGQLLLATDVRFTTEYVDNVYLTASHPSPDFILSPSFGLNAAWQVTRLNTLRLRTTLSYNKYLDNPTLDSQNLTVAPNSALTFDVFVGDFRISFHDQFSIQNETINQGSLSGIAKLPRFTNIAGLSILWDLNEVLWSLGYDHYNFLAFGSVQASSTISQTTIDQLNHTTEQISTSATFKFNSSTLAGVEAAATYSNYPDDPASNFTSITGGPFIQIQATRYTNVVIGAGYKGYSFQSGSGSGYYANIGLVHRLNRYYGDRLDAGHEDQFDALSGRTETNYVRYSSNWTFNNHLSFGISLFFENVHTSTPSVLEAVPPGDFVRYGLQLGTSYKLTEHVNASLSYQFTKKDSDDSTQNYTQNRVLVGLGYSF